LFNKVIAVLIFSKILIFATGLLIHNIGINILGKPDDKAQRQDRSLGSEAALDLICGECLR
jgi:hypothetical protein